MRYSEDMPFIDIYGEEYYVQKYMDDNNLDDQFAFYDTKKYSFSAVPKEKIDSVLPKKPSAEKWSRMRSHKVSMI